MRVGAELLAAGDNVMLEVPEVKAEVDERQRLARPHLVAAVQAGAAGTPIQVSGQRKAFRNVALHDKLGEGVDALPKTGAEATSMQRSSRRRRRKPKGSLGAGSTDGSEGVEDMEPQQKQETMVDYKPLAKLINQVQGDKAEQVFDGKQVQLAEVLAVLAGEVVQLKDQLDVVKKERREAVRVKMPLDEPFQAAARAESSAQVDGMQDKCENGDTEHIGKVGVEGIINPVGGQDKHEAKDGLVDGSVANAKEQIVKTEQDEVYGELEGTANHITMKVFKGSGGSMALAMHADDAEIIPEVNIETAVYDTLDCVNNPPLADDRNVDKRAELEGIVNPITMSEFSPGTVLEGGAAATFEERVLTLMAEKGVTRSVATLIAEAMAEVDASKAR